MKSLWKDLLFLHGHIANPRVLEPLEDQPAPAPKAPLALLPTSLVIRADFDRDAAAHAKGWKQCA
jgi:hypothetical protein